MAGSSSSYSGLKVFSASELHQATGGFHKMCMIGEGGECGGDTHGQWASGISGSPVLLSTIYRPCAGFGKVFQAMVNLTPVAIKV